MRTPKDPALVTNLRAKLVAFNNIIPLDGINNQPAMDCFLLQLEDSIRRIKYVQVISRKPHSISSTDPNLAAFNPLNAIAWHVANGNVDEASWLVFLVTHFGKNKSTGWTLIKDIYSGLGQQIWDWATVSVNPQSLGQWIDVNKALLKSRGKFGNHRKYESLNYNITGQAINSYVNWVGVNHHHIIKFAQIEPLNATPRTRFKAFDNSLNQVFRFGRTGKFDYITMMGKLNIINVEPDSVYMNGATGPLTGARLLFANDPHANINRPQLEQFLDQLEAHLAIPFGMQVLEDALCNWQKSPAHYIYFSG